MKIWTVNYEGNNIRVENNWDGEKLFVNDKLQDKRTGITTRSILIGKLQNGKQIKVSLGGTFKIHCTIFIDDHLILEE